VQSLLIRKGRKSLSVGTENAGNIKSYDVVRGVLMRTTSIEKYESLVMRFRNLVQKSVWQLQEESLIRSRSLSVTKTGEWESMKSYDVVRSIDEQALCLKSMSSGIVDCRSLNL
jgi:hypothetical protein